MTDLEKILMHRLLETEAALQQAEKAHAQNIARTSEIMQDALSRAEFAEGEAIALEGDVIEFKRRVVELEQALIVKMMPDLSETLTSSLKPIIAEGQERRSWLIFTVTIEHAQNVARQLTAGGIPCAVYHSEQDNATNDAALAAFKKGELRALINVNCLTTGLDVPDRIAIRPTRSVNSEQSLAVKMVADIDEAIASSLKPIGPL